MKLFDEIGLGLTLASDVPAVINLIEADFPTVKTELQGAYQAVLTPGKAIVADVKLVVQGGTAEVITEDTEKTVSDLGAFVSAIESLLPTLQTEAEAEYAKLQPLLQPIADAINLKLPAVQATAAASAS